MTSLRGLLADESGQNRTDYTLLALGGVALLLLVLVLVGTDFADVTRWLRRLGNLLLTR